VLSGGHERRNQNWEYPRERWNVAYSIKSDSDITALLDFFYARAGKAHTFRFRSPIDYEGTDEDLGDGEGDQTNYQLVKNYTSGDTTFARKITKPVSGTITVYVDSVEESGYSVDTDTGMVTFDTPVASGASVTATFEFDIEARFDTDFVPRQLTTYEHGAADVQIVEVKDE